MTDKQLIKEEIERRIVQAKEFAERAKGANDDSSKLSWDFVATQNKSLFQFIDSLPEESGCEANFTTKSEDLDFLVISLEETIGTSPHSREVIKEHLQKAAEWQKQQMMKDAVEGEVVYQIGSSVLAPTDIRYKVMSDRVYIPNVKLGDKVKIIIVKTEQQ